MSNIVEKLKAVDHMSVEDCFLQSPLFSQAATEIERLRASALAWQEDFLVENKRASALAETVERLTSALAKACEDERKRCAATIDELRSLHAEQRDAEYVAGNYEDGNIRNRGVFVLGIAVAAIRALG